MEKLGGLEMMISGKKVVIPDKFDSEILITVDGKPLVVSPFMWEAVPQVLLNYHWIPDTDIKDAIVVQESEVTSLILGESMIGKSISQIYSSLNITDSRLEFNGISGLDLLDLLISRSQIVGVRAEYKGNSIDLNSRFILENRQFQSTIMDTSNWEKILRARVYSETRSKFLVEINQILHSTDFKEKQKLQKLLDKMIDSNLIEGLSNIGDKGVIYLREYPSSKILNKVAYCGDDKSYLEDNIRVGEGKLGIQMSMSKPNFTNDNFQNLGSNLLAIPLGNVGVIALFIEPKHRPSDDFMNYLTLISGQIGPMLELNMSVNSDHLSGLANRKYLEERLVESVDWSFEKNKINEKYSSGLLTLDLDGFKNINDTLGHSAGDYIIVQVSERIRECVKAGDVCARVGGDEFTIICDNVQDNLSSIAVRLLNSISSPYIYDTGSSKGVVEINSITASLGGIYFGTSKDPKYYMREADSALYDVKNNGKGSIKIL